MIETHFDIDVRENESVSKEDLSSRRQDAFLSCRESLIQRSAQSYAEQFQGMYVLMRGLMAALLIGAVYHVGWGMGGLISTGRWLFALVCIAAVLLALIVLPLRYFRTRGAGNMGAWFLWDGWWLWLGMIVSCLLGVTFCSKQILSYETADTLIGIGVVASLAAYRFFRGYNYFAKEFAKSVYRGFASLEKSPSASKDK